MLCNVMYNNKVKCMQLCFPSSFYIYYDSVFFRGRILTWHLQQQRVLAYRPQFWYVIAKQDNFYVALAQKSNL